MELLDPRLAAFVAVMAVLIVTPGPDTALVIRNTIAGGSRTASLTTIGIGAGSAIWALASVLGVALILERSDLAFTVFKLAGAAYLGYLGIRSLFGRGVVPEPTRPAPPSVSDAAAFRQGALNNLLNPKAGAIFATVMPQFLAAGDTPARFVVMLVAYEVMLIAWLHVYVVALGRARRSVAFGRIQAALRRLTGAVMIGLGARLALEHR